MRIVAVSDTHLFHGELTIPPGDVFLHAGDMCRGGDSDELREAFAWIASLPHRAKIVIAGNHDRLFEDDPAAARSLVPPGVVYLQDESVVVDGVHFYGSPWTAAYNDWAFNLPRGAALAEKWAKIPAGVDVLVTHGPPFGHGDSSSVPGREGCADLLARLGLARPRVHLFGHIHEGGGVTHQGDTACINVTTWECERGPTVFSLDPQTKELELETIPPAR